MSQVDPSERAAAGPDARLVADAIQGGWIGRGFKLGIGFFLAGLVVWLIPMMLLASCVGTIAAVAAGGAMSNWTTHWSFDDDDEPSGELVAPQPSTPADAAAAEAAAGAAQADAAAAPDAS